MISCTTVGAFVVPSSVSAVGSTVTFSQNELFFFSPVAIHSLPLFPASHPASCPTHGLPALETESLWHPVRLRSALAQFTSLFHSLGSSHSLAQSPGHSETFYFYLSQGYSLPSTSITTSKFSSCILKPHHSQTVSSVLLAKMQGIIITAIDGQKTSGVHRVSIWAWRTLPDSFVTLLYLDSSHSWREISYVIG